MPIQPLNQNPEYAQADAKLATYAAELAAARIDAQRLEMERQAAPAPAEGTDALVAADALLSGEGLPTLAARIERNRTLIRALERAVRAQSEAARTIARRLSKEAAKAALSRHVELVQAVIAASEALERANAAEVACREELEQAGFDAWLPALAFAPPGLERVNLSDPYGGYCPSWHSDAKRYVAMKLLPVEIAELDAAQAHAATAVALARDAALKGARPTKGRANMGELVS